MAHGMLYFDAYLLWEPDIILLNLIKSRSLIIAQTPSPTLLIFRFDALQKNGKKFKI